MLKFGMQVMTSIRVPYYNNLYGSFSLCAMHVILNDLVTFLIMSTSTWTLMTDVSGDASQVSMSLCWTRVV